MILGKDLDLKISKRIIAVGGGTYKGYTSHVDDLSY